MLLNHNLCGADTIFNRKNDSILEGGDERARPIFQGKKSLHCSRSWLTKSLIKSDYVKRQGVVTRLRFGQLGTPSALC